MSNKNHRPKLTLVGAGPGDPELITLKGIKALAGASVILYDALIHPGLLDYAPNAIKIYVGKRAGKNSITQEEINELIVQYAFSHGDVVRLKGGDPFIFGRGQEELEYARLFSIDTEVIPGISSATGLTALQQLPLTMRGSNESFWVVTGTNSNKNFSQDIEVALHTNTTVVILMGAGNLKKIAEAFPQNQLPVAIIQDGSTEHERIIFGTMDTIVEIARVEKIVSPAIIVVGENVRLHPKYPAEIENMIKSFMNNE